MPAQRIKDTFLQVSTDSPAPNLHDPFPQPPPPPMLSIIAPTPRAFTFPSAHNLADSPSSSPSNSPFEPDRRPSLISISSIDRTLSPDTSIPTPPPTTQHKRRKSSSDVERRPRKGDEDYIKRPENAFILFRRKCVEDKNAAEVATAAVEGPSKKQRQAELSKQISAKWKGLSPEERRYWDNLAKEKKREHEKLYPDYVYRPQRTKKGLKAKRKENEEYPDSVHFILPAHPSSRHGRSASAPTPPPYQSVTFPNIFGSSGSCPTSPSLLPMIHRRGSSGDSLGFDFIPPDSLAPPATFGMSMYESNDPVPSMYSQRIPHEVASNLPSLSHHHSMPTHPHNVASPSSSGTSSPNHGPFTPTSSMLSNSFPSLPAESSTCGTSHHGSIADQFQFQYYQERQQSIDFPGYSWDNSSVWGQTTDAMFPGDFDIDAIPPIELGIPKFDDQMVVGGQPEFTDDFPRSFEGGQPTAYDDSQLATLNFDDVIRGASF